jgi:hypothetical protein
MQLLDEIIKYRVGYHPELLDDYGNVVQPAVNQEDYELMTGEINQHISAMIPEEERLTFEQLSPIAQDIMREWESLVEMYSGGGKSVEEPEDYKVGPLDV